MLEDKGQFHKASQSYPAQGLYVRASLLAAIEILAAPAKRKWHPIGLPLAEISQTFAEVVEGLIGQEARLVVAGAGWTAETARDPLHPSDDLDYWEHRLEQTVERDTNIPETDRRIDYEDFDRASS